MSDTLARQEVIKGACNEILQWIPGEDPKREGLLKTPARMAKMLQDLTKGYSEDPEAIIRAGCFTSEGEGIVITGEIPFYSLCEHHLAPFFGTVCVGYLPKEKIIGLSKIPRVIQAYARRLQVQERLTKQIADAIFSGVEAKGVGVIVRAEHLCVAMRGIEKPGTKTTTCEVRGLFKESQVLRQEFFTLANLKP